MKAKCISIFIFFSINIFAQKHIITIAEAEQMLQQNNLMLLAEQYNIAATKAAVIQAKIWDQPYITSEANLITPQQDKIFSVGKNGQKAFAIQQLIYLGGKKKNEIAFAKASVGLSEMEFEQLLRTLKYQLSQNFYSVFFDKQKIASLDTQIKSLDTLLQIYTDQTAKGNVPLKELMRLQSLLTGLKNDRNNLLKDVIENQQSIVLLTGIPDSIESYELFVDEEGLLNYFQTKIILKDSVLSYAIANNIDYLKTEKVFEGQKIFLKWQKTLAIPDITLGISYDQNGGAFTNQTNLTLGMPLPLWNKNRGNIKIAESQLEQSKINREFKKQELVNKVEVIWALWQKQKALLSTIDKSVASNFNIVYQGVLTNFQKRNISMLEFTDYLESYRQTTNQINEIKKSFVLYSVNLNFITNNNVF